VYCDDVDALCKRAEAAGATVESPPADMFWGDRTCTLVDPDGYKWCFGTHTGKKFEFNPASCDPAQK
jgi:PhnB protein